VLWSHFPNKNVLSDSMKQLYDKSGCLRPVDSRSSCTEGSVAEIGLRLTDNKCTSLSRVQCSWANVGDETAVFRQIAGGMPRQCMVEKGSDLKLDALRQRIAGAAGRGRWDVVAFPVTSQTAAFWIDWRQRIRSSVMCSDVIKSHRSFIVLIKKTDSTWQISSVKTSELEKNCSHESACNTQSTAVSSEIFSEREASEGECKNRLMAPDIKGTRSDCTASVHFVNRHNIIIIRHKSLTKGIKTKSSKPAYPPATTLTNARWRCRKWATTMCTYWSSSSRPLPMKHRCSPAAAALALSACSLLASNACTAVVNSGKLISIWTEQGEWQWQQKVVYQSNQINQSIKNNQPTPQWSQQRPFWSDIATVHADYALTTTMSSTQITISHTMQPATNQVSIKVKGSW